MGAVLVPQPFLPFEDSGGLRKPSGNEIQISVVYVSVHASQMILNKEQTHEKAFY